MYGLGQTITNELLSESTLLCLLSIGFYRILYPGASALTLLYRCMTTGSFDRDICFDIVYYIAYIGRRTPNS